MSTEQELDVVTSMQTAKRRSKANDLSGALAFLVSDAVEFVTAQIIHVDGGLSRSGA